MEKADISLVEIPCIPLKKETDDAAHYDTVAVIRNSFISVEYNG